MECLRQIETIILLLAAVLALITIARNILIPYPILLVIGGLLLDHELDVEALRVGIGEQLAAANKSTTPQQLQEQ